MKIYGCYDGGGYTVCLTRDHGGNLLFAEVMNQDGEQTSVITYRDGEPFMIEYFDGREVVFMD